MVRESEQNIIDHIKYILNNNYKIFERGKRKLLEANKIWGKKIMETT